MIPRFVMKELYKEELPETAFFVIYCMLAFMNELLRYRRARQDFDMDWQYARRKRV